MGIFNFLRSKKNDTKTSESGSYFDTDIKDSELRLLVNKAISVFQNNPGVDDNEIITKIKSYRDDEPLALALYRFIPIAYCRLFIPEPKYSDQYVLFIDKKQQKSFAFSSDKIYNIVLSESRRKFLEASSQDNVLPILFHSADFNAINNALKNGSELKNLTCSPSFFLQRDAP